MYCITQDMFHSCFLKHQGHYSWLWRLHRILEEAHFHAWTPEHLIIDPLGYFIEYHPVGGTVGVDSLYFPVGRGYGIVRAAASAVFYMGAVLAVLVHVLFVIEHELPGI